MDDWRENYVLRPAERLWPAERHAVHEAIRVIIVSDYAWVAGGASKVAMLSAIALARKGYDVYHFSAVGPVADKLAGAPLTIQCLEERRASRNQKTDRCSERFVEPQGKIRVDALP